MSISVNELSLHWSIIDFSSEHTFDIWEKSAKPPFPPKESLPNESDAANGSVYEREKAQANE